MRANEHWWQKCPLVKRYMPEEEGVSISDILQELDTLISDGYSAIHITAPYKSAGTYPWWGLRPLDYFQLNQSLGTDIAEFKRLVQVCHQKGLHVMIFLNLGYADIYSDLWKEACLARKNRYTHSPADFFLWSDTGEDSLPVPGNRFFRQGGQWVYSPEACSYYWNYWQEGGIAEPQYNWGSEAWQAYAVRVLNFWLDTGIDGVIVDAVNWYLNCDFRIMRRCITDVIHRRPEVCCIPEGGCGFGDEPVHWMKYGNFDIIEDQPFHSDLNWNGSAIMEAILAQSALELPHRLQSSSIVRASGSSSWSYLSYHKFDQNGFLLEWTPEYRLLELAVLFGTGHIVDVIGTYVKPFSPEHTRKLKQLLQFGKEPGLAPCESVRYLKTGNEALFACLRSERNFPVLCLYNFSSHSIEMDTTQISRLLSPYCTINYNLQKIVHLSAYGYLFIPLK